MECEPNLPGLRLFIVPLTSCVGFRGSVFFVEREVNPPCASPVPYGQITCLALTLFALRNLAAHPLVGSSVMRHFLVRRRRLTLAHVTQLKSTASVAVVGSKAAFEAYNSEAGDEGKLDVIDPFAQE